MDTEVPLTKVVTRLLGGDSFSHSEIDAAVSITAGLTGLKNGKTNLPLELLQQWEGLINQIRTGRAAPDHAKPLIYREDGMPG